MAHALAAPEGLTDPAYVALLTTGVLGAGLWAYGKFGGGEGEGALNEHFQMMAKGGMILAGVGIGSAVLYLLWANRY